MKRRELGPTKNDKSAARGRIWRKRRGIIKVGQPQGEIKGNPSGARLELGRAKCTKRFEGREISGKNRGGGDSTSEPRKKENPGEKGGFRLQKSKRNSKHSIKEKRPSKIKSIKKPRVATEAAKFQIEKNRKSSKIKAASASVTKYNDNVLTSYLEQWGSTSKREHCFINVDRGKGHKKKNFVTKGKERRNSERVKQRNSTRENNGGGGVLENQRGLGGGGVRTGEKLRDDSENGSYKNFLGPTKYWGD